MEDSGSYYKSTFHLWRKKKEREKKSLELPTCQHPHKKISSCWTRADCGRQRDRRKPCNGASWLPGKRNARGCTLERTENCFSLAAKQTGWWRCHFVDCILKSYINWPSLFVLWYLKGQSLMRCWVLIFGIVWWVRPWKADFLGGYLDFVSLRVAIAKTSLLILFKADLWQKCFRHSTHL